MLATHHTLVPELQLGNAFGSEALLRTAGVSSGRLRFHDEAGASQTIAFPSWSLGTSVTMIR